MPRWEVHLTTGLGASILISFGLLMGVYDRGGMTNVLSAAGRYLLPLSLGTLALLAGSVLPDLDGRGMVRWFVGPLAGAMALVPPLAGRMFSGNVSGGLDFLYGPGARLFLFSCAVGYMMLLVPFEHRGFLHSHRAALIFGTVWGGYLLFHPFFDPVGPFLAGAMGYLGYSWHLALDGKL
ncbi:MAG: metal-dependent hydrolase [Candidatus Thermoplasmatota archaeon]|jgi:hypothetical protein|nr:metal-dependent hydrolase [Candidatus Thermoplasmatota archaeon]